MLDELVITLAGKLVAELIILRGGLILFPASSALLISPSRPKTTRTGASIAMPRALQR